MQLWSQSEVPDPTSSKVRKSATTCHQQEKRLNKGTTAICCEVHAASSLAAVGKCSEYKIQSKLHKRKKTDSHFFSVCHRNTWCRHSLDQLIEAKLSSIHDICLNLNNKSETYMVILSLVSSFSETVLNSVSIYLSHENLVFTIVRRTGIVTNSYFSANDKEEAGTNT